MDLLPVFYMLRASLLAAIWISASASLQLRRDDERERLGACDGVAGVGAEEDAHRLVVEGHCCMLVGTMSPTQHFHIIGAERAAEEDDGRLCHLPRVLRLKRSCTQGWS